MPSTDVVLSGKYLLLDPDACLTCLIDRKKINDIYHHTRRLLVTAFATLNLNTFPVRLIIPRSSSTFFPSCHQICLLQIVTTSR